MLPAAVLLLQVYTGLDPVHIFTACPAFDAGFCLLLVLSKCQQVNGQPGTIYLFQKLVDSNDNNSH
jgi:hypothetical protein